MARIMLAPAFALVAVLVGSGFATAAEPANPATGFTMTLGGKGTAAEAATAKDDTEETWCCRRKFYGCYGGYGWGGYGYSSYYSGGFGYGGGYGYSNYYSYRPAYYHSYAYRPHYYRPYVNYYGGYGYGGFGGGFYVGINGTADDSSAPVMTLSLAAARNPVAAAQPRSTEPATPGTFRYDGGPANPVPQVKPDAAPRSQTPPAAAGLPVSLKKESASPYRYKAYGEK